jgi:hypothetical protein
LFPPRKRPFDASSLRSTPIYVHPRIDAIFRSAHKDLLLPTKANLTKVRDAKPRVPVSSATHSATPRRTPRSPGRQRLEGTRTMTITAFQITAVIFVVGATIALFITKQRYMAAAAERRMMSMLESVGLDPAIARSGEPDSVLKCVIEASIKEIRQRCRACTSKDECERWLGSDEQGDNDFCPKARVFDALKEICSADARL